MIDVSAVVMIGVGVDALADAKIIVVVTAVEIGFEFIVRAAFVVEVLADMRAGAITGGGTGVGAGVNVSGFAAVMTALEVVALASSAEPFLSC